MFCTFAYIVIGGVFMNKGNNDPVLFVSSVSDTKIGQENQSIYDSRRTVRKKVARHRLEDINAMLLYKINILCEVRTDRYLYEGVVKDVNEDNLKLIVENKEVVLPINEIEDINILKI